MLPSEKNYSSARGHGKIYSLDTYSRAEFFSAKDQIIF